jgi:hypothetical protein
MKMTDQNEHSIPKRVIFKKTTSAKNVSSRAEVYPKFTNQLIEAYLRGENFCFSK